MHKLRLFFVITILVIELLVVGCGKTYKEENITGRNRAENIYNAILHDDIDTILKYFSPYVDERIELADGLKQLMNFPKGELKGYKKILSSIVLNTKKETENSEIITGIVDDLGNSYTIYINSCSFNEEFPEFVGIYSIQLVHEDTNEYIYIGLEDDFPE